MNRIKLLVALTAALWVSAQPSSLHAQTVVNVVSGNGQLVICGAPLVTSFPPFCQTPFMPMVVQVTNASGVPQGGVSVNWVIAATGGSVLLNASTTVTDGNGTTQNALFFLNGRGPQPTPFQQFFQNTITASTADSTAAFTLTEAPYEPASSQTPVVAIATGLYANLLVGGTLSGQSGTSGSTPLTLRLGTSRGLPVPNVGVQLVSLGDPSTSPVVSCKESTGGPGVALTDANGIASCTPQFSGTPGNGRFYALIGAGGVPPADPAAPPSTSLYFGQTNVTVTAAAVGSLSVVSGNSQTGAPGQTLAPFQVEVDGANGAPLSGQQVSWTSTPAGAIGFTGAVTTTDVTGRTSILGTLSGTSNGNITVTATSVSDPSKKVTFNVTSVPPVVVTGFTTVSGNNQTAQINQAFSQPLVVQVTVSAGTPANVPVQFRVTGGSVTLSATSVSTDASGQARVNVTAGSITGSASVQATVATSGGTGTQNFQLTITPAAPPITSGSFVNGADQQANSLSPCSIGMLVAPVGALGISNVTPSFPGQPVNANVRITFNNIGAPILGVGTLPNGTQQGVSFQVPCETAAGNVPVAVTIGGAATNVTVNVQAASPGIFQQLGSDGILRAVVVRPDGSFVSLTNPARKGENVSVFVTGMGPTSPTVGTYSLPSIGGAPANVSGTVIAGISGGGAPVVSAKLSEDLAGVYVITFTVPDDAATGSNVAISMGLIPTGSGSAIYSGTTKIPIQ